MVRNAPAGHSDHDPRRRGSGQNRVFRRAARAGDESPLASAMVLLLRTKERWPARPPRRRSRRQSRSPDAGPAIRRSCRRVRAGARPDPDDDQVRIQYATCLFAAERNEDARKQFEIERRRRGERPGLNYYLGQLDLRANDFACASNSSRPWNPFRPSQRLALYRPGLPVTGAAGECDGVPGAGGEGNPQDPEVHYRLARVYSVPGAAPSGREYKLYRDSHESQRLAEEGGRIARRPARAAHRKRTPFVSVCRIRRLPRLGFLGQLYSGHGAFVDSVEPLRQAVRVDPCCSMPGRRSVSAFTGWSATGRRFLRCGRPSRLTRNFSTRYFARLHAPRPGRR